MAIRPISRRKFDDLQPGHRPLGRLRVEQHDWYADEGGSVLVAVVLDRSGGGWGYAVLSKSA